jgi:hypothetical protein
MEETSNMTFIRRTALALALVTLAACLLACGNVRQAAARAKRQNDLMQLGVAAHSYAAANNDKMPPDQASFLRFAQQAMPEAVPVIQQTGPGGSITFEYGAFRMPQDFVQGTSNTVLAYDNAIWPGGMRLVVMADGSARQMTEAELNAAPRPRMNDKK